MDTTPFPPADARLIGDRYRAELELLNRALDTCDSIAEKLNGRPMAGMSRVQFFVLFQFVKSLKTARAVHRLFSTGFDEDAEMLLRVLVEQAIVVHWMRTEDSDAKARAYALYLRQNRLKILQTAQRFIREVPLPDSLIKEIEEDGAEYRKLGKDEKWLQMTGDVAALAADAGEPESYAVHLNGTNLVHSNPVRERSYIRSVDRGTFFNVAASIPESGWTPVLAAKHLLWTASALNEAFDFDAEDTIRAVATDVDSYRPSQ
jgi:hypothetical protein